MRRTFPRRSHWLAYSADDTPASAPWADFDLMREMLTNARRHLLAHGLIMSPHHNEKNTAFRHA